MHAQHHGTSVVLRGIFHPYDESPNHCVMAVFSSPGSLHEDDVNSSNIPDTHFEKNSEQKLWQGKKNSAAQCRSVQGEKGVPLPTIFPYESGWFTHFTRRELCAAKLKDEKKGLAIQWLT